MVGNYALILLEAQYIFAPPPSFDHAMLLSHHPVCRFLQCVRDLLDFYNPYSYIFFSVMSVLVNCLNCDSPSPFWYEHMLCSMSFFITCFLLGIVLSYQYTCFSTLSQWLSDLLDIIRSSSICFWSLITLKLTIVYMFNSSKTWYNSLHFLTLTACPFKALKKIIFGQFYFMKKLYTNLNICILLIFYKKYVYRFICQQLKSDINSSHSLSPECVIRRD